MKSLNSVEEYSDFLKNNSASLIYFSTDECSVCKVLKPQLELLVTKNFPKIETCYVNTLIMTETAAQNSVFTVPTIVLFFNGREYLRKSRSINFEEFENELNRLYKLFFYE